MAVVEVELIPELFRRMSMHPAEAALDRVGRAAVAGQGVGGFLGRHRCKRDDAAGWLIYTHEVSPKRQIGRELYARAPVGARRRSISCRASFAKRQNLRTCGLANDTSRAAYNRLQPSLTCLQPAAYSPKSFAMVAEYGY